MQHLILTSTNLESSILKAVETLATGGVVMYPTETVYGIATDATNPAAVSRLLKYKNRPAGKPISILVTDQEQAEEFVILNDQAKQLYKTFLPGPLTVISESTKKADSRLESEFGTLGIRISSHPVAQALIKAYGKPITATSANSSGKARPYTVKQALDSLSDGQKDCLDLVLDFGTLPHRDPSTVIDTTQTTQEIVRAGAHFTDLKPTFTSHSEEETRGYAHSLMKSLLYQVPEQSVVFALEGEMGAGKTHFAKGVAEAVGVTKIVSSPTYVLVKEYEGSEGKKFIHMDCWRLEKVSPGELGLEEYVQPQHVLVVEWASPLLPYLKDRGIAGYHLFFTPLDETTREIRVETL